MAVVTVVVPAPQGFGGGGDGGSGAGVRGPTKQPLLLLVGAYFVCPSPPQQVADRVRSHCVGWCEVKWRTLHNNKEMHRNWNFDEWAVRQPIHRIGA